MSDNIYPDHPRRCGENHFKTSCFVILAGSPPQVRGKPELYTTAQAPPRITPAGAGKTALCCQYCCRLWDHPRRCGENDCRRWRLHRALGSPPQVRGKPNDETSISAHTGITPAGAGKTCQRWRAWNDVQDHPRRCGENTAWASRWMGFRGSPPQVRGKHAWELPIYPTDRITPAGAGKTECPVSAV